MAARGIRAVTMDEIASRLGISKKTIYQYFKDKDAIVEAIFTAHIHLQFDSAQPAGGSMAELLATHMMRTAAHTHAVCPQCAEDLRRFYPEILRNYLAERHAQAHRVLGELLARGVQSGEVRPEVDHEAAIDLITELPGLLARSERAESLGYPLRRLQRAMIELLARGLLTEVGLREAQKFFDTWRD